ncbi:MAG: hypothetical protein IT538_03300 [Variibacter sp.]|nr:hypothetical protein [Variibacter sp.]
MKKVLFLVLALVLGGLFASSTYDDASAKGRAVVVKKKKKRVANRAEWIRTPAIVTRTWTWGWWTPRPTYYGTPIWTLARYGHRGVYLRR